MNKDLISFDLIVVGNTGNTLQITHSQTPNDFYSVCFYSDILVDINIASM